MLLVHANLARGTSGSPTFYVASDGSARAVGVAVSALGGQTANGVAALDQDKIAWINAQS
jgi:RNase H-fold protein (predicted Holliday junction resolvase)